MGAGGALYLAVFCPVHVCLMFHVELAEVLTVVLLSDRLQEALCRTFTHADR